MTQVLETLPLRRFHTDCAVDVVVWDSHPLALGATPKQVFVDGIPQIDEPFISPKPAAFQRAPAVPDFEQEARDAVKYEGLPPLESKSSLGGEEPVLFVNVSEVFYFAQKAVLHPTAPLYDSREHVRSLPIPCYRTE